MDGDMQPKMAGKVTDNGDGKTGWIDWALLVVVGPEEERWDGVNNPCKVMPNLENVFGDMSARLEFTPHYINPN